MRLIKFALIVMGIMIIAGFGFVGFVSYQRMTGVGTFAKPPAKPTLEGSLAELETLAATPTTVTLGLPDGARVESIHDVGSRVLLLVRQAATGDFLYLIDPRTGTLTAAIALGKTPPALPQAVPAAKPPAPPIAEAK